MNHRALCWDEQVAERPEFSEDRAQDQNQREDYRGHPPSGRYNVTKWTVPRYLRGRPRARWARAPRGFCVPWGMRGLFDHLFWNTAESQKDTARAGGYIARRLLQAEDLEGLAWGAENLRPVDWRHAAATRGVTPAALALAHNLAGDAR